MHVSSTRQWRTVCVQITTVFISARMSVIGTRSLNGGIGRSRNLLYAQTYLILHPGVPKFETVVRQASDGKQDVCMDQEASRRFWVWNERCLQSNCVSSEVPMRRRLDVCRAVDLQAILFSDRHKPFTGIVSTWSTRLCRLVRTPYDYKCNYASTSVNQDDI